MYEYSTKVTLSKEKSGATVWWVMHYEPMLDDPQPMDEDVYETLKVFAGMVKKENETVNTAYQQALVQNDLTENAVDAIEGVVADLETDLIDEE